MRFNRSKPKRNDFDIVITSMLDINFLLIMFFMVTAHFQRETHANLKLPLENGEKQVQSDDAGLVINITSDGGLIVSGKAVAFEDVRRLVQTEVDKQPKGSTEKVKLMVRADREAPVRHLNKVVAMLRELGVGAIRIATEIPA